MIWTSQARHNLSWLLCFVSLQHGPLSKTWELTSYEGDAQDVTFYLDASPFSLAGILVVDGWPVQYFTSPLSHHDAAIHRKKLGDSSGQQVWESLAVLVALTVWFPFWPDRRYCFTIKSDNTSALTLAGSLKGNKSLGLIAKEVSLLYCRAQYEPKFLSHIAGATNVAADALSRLNDPAHAYAVPPWLHECNCKEVKVPLRTTAYYKTLGSANPSQVG